MLFCRSRNISQKGRNRARRSKKVYKHRGCRHRHTRDSQGWQHCVVIPLAKHLAGTTGKVEKVKAIAFLLMATARGCVVLLFAMASSAVSLSLWPNFILTQFLTNHGKFRAYLYKMKKTTSPICNCPEKAIQTAGHLMTECSLFSRNRPALLHNLPPHLILKFHIHTASVSSFLSNIFHSMSEQLEGNQAQQKRHVQQSTAIM